MWRRIEAPASRAVLDLPVQKDHSQMEIPAWLATVSPMGALVMVVLIVGLSIIRGQWVPEKLHERIIQAKDEAIQSQKQTTDKMVNTNERLLAQSNQQLENDETIIHLLQSLPKGEGVGRDV